MHNCTVWLLQHRRIWKGTALSWASLWTVSHNSRYKETALVCAHIEG